jgi:hypothetical protein
VTYHFNIVADALSRDCKAEFQADEGMIVGEDPVEVQQLLDLYEKKFAAVGLKMNADKTKAIAMAGGDVSAYVQRSIPSSNNWRGDVMD